MSDRRPPGPNTVGSASIGSASIVPDTKDWTWVLERACPDCGFDASTTPPAAVAGAIIANAESWVVILDHRADIRRRPQPATWSTLEYACHVRDVLRLGDQRVEVMLGDDDPVFANWDQDETAVACRYELSDPVVVAGELRRAAGALAARLSGVDGVSWERRGRRSDGAEFTVGSFARYVLHDPVHHLYDVGASGR